MKAREAGSSNHRQPSRWLALLTVLVSLSLLVPPSQICALMEAAPGHSGSHSHGASSHSHGSGHQHKPGGAHHEDHAHAADAHHDASRLSFAPVEPPDTCCGQSEPIPIVAASASRFTAPHQSSAPVAYAPAILPPAHEIFTLTNCHGRDGPPDKPLRSQFVPLSLLGRAPPASV